MDKQYIKALIEKATGTSGGDEVYKIIASTSAVDRQGDVIDQAGWDLSDFKKNPVVLWAHDYTLPPIAKAIDIEVIGENLIMSFTFAPTEFAQSIKALVDGGFQNASSVGFIPMERQGNTITKAQLLEVSLVPVPANQQALMLAAKSFESKGVAAEVVEKFVATLTEKEVEVELEVAAEVVAEPVVEAEPVAEVVADEVVAEPTAEKGAVSDELDAEEASEQKWSNLDEFFEIIGAFVDVYLDEQTPVEAYSQLLLEVASLVTALAANGPDNDDDNAPQTAALRKLVAKSVSHEMKALLVEKIGARHSSDTKDAMQSAIEHCDAASAVLKGLLETTPSIEDEGTSADDEPASQEEGEKGIDAARTLLAVRGVLREKRDSEQSALTLINAFLKTQEMIA